MKQKFLIQQVQYKLVIITLFVVTCMKSGLAEAEQVLFEKSILNKGYRYDHQWLNIDKEPQSLSFVLSQKDVNDNYRHFKALRPSLLKMYSLRKLKQQIGKLDPRKGKVKILPSYQDINFEIQGRDQEWVNHTSKELTDVYHKSLKEYLYQEYYVEFSGFTGRSSNPVITYKPDHKRFVEESGPSLVPIITAIKEKLPRASARNVAKFILPWLQNIPYNTMESRTESNGAGFLPPIKVLDRNQGDCDSKVTLMASLLKQMFPRLRIAIIYIPEHALIGMNVSHLQEDYVLDIDGLDYTLAEPVGPGMIKFADISDRSKRYIESGNYRVELLFNR